MHIILKLVFFALFLFVMISGFLKIYRFLNQKITGSKTLLGVVGYALLLILINLVLFGGGIFAFLKVYAFLTLPS